jgi:hypothetical protein
MIDFRKRLVLARLCAVRTLAPLSFPLLLFLDIIPPSATKLLPSSEDLYHSRLIDVVAAGVWCQSLSESGVIVLMKRSSFPERRLVTDFCTGTR